MRMYGATFQLCPNFMHFMQGIDIRMKTQHLVTRPVPQAGLRCLFPAEEILSNI